MNKKFLEKYVNCESKKGFWEIIVDDEDLRLMFFEEDDAVSKNTININYEQFKDLVKFMKKLDKMSQEK